ncbi:MAG TPA: hypothetical protein ENK62_01715 [Chromatiales bacterium]|nr:hypothetical protein [Chromatiales bacterium]
MTPADLVRVLDRHLRTETFPLGILRLDPGAEPPERAKRPLRDMGTRIAICQGISIARRYGWTVAMGAEDMACPVARAVFGFEEPVEYYTEGNLAAGMYARDLPAGRRMEEALERCAPGELEGIAVGPLERIDREPETVLVYGNSAQVLRLVNAALWEEGGSLPSDFSGRADCSDIVLKAARTGRPQVILPCYGDRVFGMTADHEMAFTFPFSWAARIAEGLEQTHRAGVRYPIPQFLRFEPSFPPSYRKLESIWRSG